MAFASRSSPRRNVYQHIRKDGSEEVICFHAAKLLNMLEKSYRQPGLSAAPECNGTFSDKKKDMPKRHALPFDEVPSRVELLYTVLQTVT